MGAPPKSSFDSARFLKSLTSKPGVYLMIDADGDVIYVGKAKQLKKRVSSYFKKTHTDKKTAVMVKHIADIKITITHNENEALILENTLIKRHKPRYNVLFRDDKTYPYICLSEDKDFPRLYLVRGRPEKKARYFGPYPNALAAKESLHFLQKLFQLRQCTNHFFKHRTRPCLQHQIKRCSAPCVGGIDSDQYHQAVQHTVMFLQGKNKKIMSELIDKMEKASSDLQFEQAAMYRDQIEKLRQVLTQQHVSHSGNDDVDVITALKQGHLTCVQVLFIRAGRVIGHRAYFPKVPDQMEIAEIVCEFIPQYYLGTAHQHDIPGIIIVDAALSESDWLASGLTEQAGRTVKIIDHARGDRERWLTLARTNAQYALSQRLSDKMHMHERFTALQQAVGFMQLPQRLECFDISHTQGEATVASCVVFDQTGPVNSAYRRFNIKGIQEGDDYAAMYQALKRRYTRLKTQEGIMPDLLIIDGGKGQLHQAQDVLEELQINDIVLLAIAKGPTRKAGLETLFLSTADNVVQLAADSPALHLIQHIRDEAHRFAITAHRQQRAKARQVSALEHIPGVGHKRRQMLLRYFGGQQGVQQASVDELSQVPGISQNLAELIYRSLHDS